MNYFKNIFTYAAALLLTAGAFSSCADDIELKGQGSEDYDNIGANQAYLRNALSPASSAVDLFEDTPLTLEMTVGLTKKANHAVDLNVTIDPAVLAEYNAKNGTSYEQLPEGLATLRNDGAVLVPPTFFKADPVRISVASSDDLVEGRTYALPLRLTCSDAGVDPVSQSTCICYVKYQGARKSAAKPGGYKVQVCIEVNDCNPLNAGEVYLKDSDIPLFDYVVLFSSNINFNAETGRAYVNNNANVRHILENREKYIKPLQDKGIKVIFSIMGNGDKAGLAGLTRSSAIYFARELKTFIDTYELDGIFFDDEYSVYAPGPGFLDVPSYDGAARLVFECKRAMPDKVNFVFGFGFMGQMPNQVDGLDPGTFIDYIASNYSQSGTGSGNSKPSEYLGLQQSQILGYCQEFSRAMFISTPAFASKIKTEGFGGTMIFNMNPMNLDWDTTQFIWLNNVSKGLWNEEVVIKRKYAKDW